MEAVQNQACKYIYTMVRSSERAQVDPILRKGRGIATKRAPRLQEWASPLVRFRFFLSVYNHFFFYFGFCFFLSFNIANFFIKNEKKNKSRTIFVHEFIESREQFPNFTNIFSIH